ncbi:MAG: cation-translocating P-type ATPase, partial [Planctomycetales bacterium]|nr:cation-translocating P-type ATPase [Planctomycetales bacterium]
SDSPRETPHAVGDPTEVALVVVAAKQGLTKPELDALLPRVGEVPFDSERKRMTTVHRLNFSDGEAPADVSREVLRRVRQPLAELNAADGVAFLKGATDAVLDCCQYVWEDSGPRTLDDSRLEQIRTANDELAAGGMRVLAVAFRPVDDIQASPFDESVESEMIFIGLLGMLDPPRAEVEEAVARCRTAGIRPVMITGDHPLTAMHIARSLGIADDREAMTGRELTEMGVADLEPVVGDVSVYARVAPKDKLHIVRALQNQGHIVAMTGDGVNDAPALKQSHIGVAMGKIGTDVSKEAAQMVLLDDNFATIVNAVEEGRIVYDNIRKFVKYTMTSNAGEVAVMLLGPLFGMPLPLLPLQILWINLVTDGLPGLALAVEPAERGTMNRPPHPPREHIFDRRMAVDIVWIGLLMGVVSLAMGYFQWQTDAESTRQWRTLVFTVLTLSQMGNALAIRTSTDSLFRVGLLSN